MIQAKRGATLFCAAAAVALGLGCVSVETESGPRAAARPGTCGSAPSTPGACGSAPSTPGACGSAPSTANAQTAVGNAYVGLWEGAGGKGHIYAFKFADTEWESYIEKGGIAMPYFKGSYTRFGARIYLLVTDEVDTNTMEWAPHDGHFPPITGRLRQGWQVMGPRPRGRRFSVRRPRACR